MAKRSITIRFEESDAEALEEKARAARQATGDAVSLSDLVRKAVREYLKHGDDNAERD